MRERELARRWQLIRREPAHLDEVVCGARVACHPRRPRQAEDDAPVVRLEPEAQELERLELEARLLAHLATEAVERQLVLAQEPTRKIPQTLAGIERAAAEEHAAVVV